VRRGNIELINHKIGGNFFVQFPSSYPGFMLGSHLAHSDYNNWFGANEGVKCKIGYNNLFGADEGINVKLATTTGLEPMKE